MVSLKAVFKKTINMFSSDTPFKERHMHNLPRDSFKPINKSLLYEKPNRNKISKTEKLFIYSKITKKIKNMMPTPHYAPMI
jgi:hypothetical protein